jgi:uncharacterized membrane protein
METPERNLDTNGKESSKRYWANRVMTLSLIMVALHYVLTTLFAILKVGITIPFPTEIWYGLIGSGFALLGITIFESKTK